MFIVGPVIQARTLKTLHLCHCTVHRGQHTCMGFKCLSFVKLWIAHKHRQIACEQKKSVKSTIFPVHLIKSDTQKQRSFMLLNVGLNKKDVCFQFPTLPPFVS